MTIFRYVVRHFLIALFAALAGMSALFLIVDFADRAKIYSGDGWLQAVIELYLCKLAMVVYQLAPAALGLAGAIAMSALRKTGEVKALRSLGRGPLTFALPVGAVALVVGLTLFALEDPVVVPANYRAEEITAVRFNRWGDWSSYHMGRRWFRGSNDRIYYLGRFEGEGFSDVTIYDLTKDFRLRRRVDAKQIQPEADGRWRLVDVVTRTFPDGDGPMREEREAQRFEAFPDDVRLFRVKTGRPSQLRRWELPAQVAIREKLGLPSREWRLSLHERRAYQLLGIPGALIGAALALRPRRKGHLTAAIAEGFAVTIGLWSVSVIARTLALGGHLAPELGGWLPMVIASVVAIVALRFAR